MAVDYYKQQNREKLLEVYEKHFSHTKNIKYVLVGGTNGKGTTSSYIKQLIEHEGKRCGILLSPHVCFINERIQVMANYIPSKEIGDIVQKYIDVFIEYDLSFFEIMLFVALDWFSQNKVEFAILEVGIGGEYDASNIVSPILSVLTNVTYDHQEILGNTIEEITMTKLGITRKDKPLFVGGLANKEVVKIVREESKVRGFVPHILRMNLNTDNGHDRNSFNFQLAISVVSTLIPDMKMDKMLKFNELSALPARITEVVTKKKKVIVDGSHNVDSIEKLLLMLGLNDKYCIYLGVKKGKDVSSIIKLLDEDERIKKIYLVDINEDWAVDWDEKSCIKNCSQIKYSSLGKEISRNENNIVCGSLYFCGKFLKDIYFNKHHKSFISDINISSFFGSELKTF